MSEPTPLSAEEQLLEWAKKHPAQMWREYQAQEDEATRLQEKVAEQAATIQAQAVTVAELRGEIERLTTQRDKAETTLEMVKALADGYGWLAEGRGSYRYDDGRYDDDVRAFATQLHELLPSGNWLGFPEWEAKYRRMEAEIEGYRQALEKAHRDRIAQSNGYSCGCWWDNKDDEAPGGVTLIVSPDCWLQRVLAGKEAQG